jgi:hypothetical protein
METVVSYNATTFYDRDRKLQGVFAAARDVTERRRLDKVLLERNVELRAPRDAIIAQRKYGAAVGGRWYIRVAIKVTTMACPG